MTLRRTIGAAVVALSLAALSACGGDDDHQEDTLPSESESAEEPESAEESESAASEDDFCDAVNRANRDLAEGATSGDEDTEIDLDDAIDTLNETGTPEGISDDARNGFEFYVDALGEINGETIADLNEPAEENSLSEDDWDDYDAFNEYVASTCA